MDVLRRFISHIRDCESTQRSEKAQTLVTLCNVLLHDLNDKVNSAIETYKLKLKATSAVTILVRLRSCDALVGGEVLLRGQLPQR